MPDFGVDYVYSIGGKVGFGIGGLISLEVVDQEGTQSDTMTMIFDGSVGGFPTMGAALPVQMGLTELAGMGRFTVDEIEQAISKSTGLQNTIRCRAADIGSKFKGHRTVAYHNKTLGQIVGEIASRNGLGAQVLGAAANIKYDFLAQSDESDLHFMTRLARKHDAIGAPKNGKLVFGKKGEKPFGNLLVIPQMVIGAQASQKTRPEHKEAEGSWWDRDNVKRIYEAGKSAAGDAKNGIPPLWPDGPEDAKEAAASRGSELSRARKSISLTIVGNPAAMAEAHMTVKGVGALIDGEYRIKTATHRITKAQGYQTTIEGELPE